VRPKQFDQHAFVIGVEMLHQHKSHAGVGRHVVEEASERGKPAGDAPMPTTSEGGRLRIALDDARAALSDLSSIPCRPRLLTALDQGAHLPTPEPIIPESDLRPFGIAINKKPEGIGFHR